MGLTGTSAADNRTLAALGAEVPFHLGHARQCARNLITDLDRTRRFVPASLDAHVRGLHRNVSRAAADTASRRARRNAALSGMPDRIIAAAAQDAVNAAANAPTVGTSALLATPSGHLPAHRADLGVEWVACIAELAELFRIKDGDFGPVAAAVELIKMNAIPVILGNDLEIWHDWQLQCRVTGRILPARIAGRPPLVRTDAALD